MYRSQAMQRFNYRIMKKYQKILKFSVKSVLALILIWLLASLYLTLQAPNLIFKNKISWASIPYSPYLNYKLNWEKTTSGQNFSIWEIPNAQSDEYLIYYHGNEGRLLHFLPEMYKKYSIISPAYPGFSESEGKPSPEATYDAALKTYDWLIKKGIPENKITILGHSMGGAPATYVASQKSQAKKLILINTFSSLQSMCYREYYILCIFSDHIFNSANYAKNVTIPVRQFAYKNDDTVPFDEGKKLYEVFEKSNDKKFFELDNYSHAYPDFNKIMSNI
ncbi:alpha/beta hydrolase [Calothrix sp. UHCC 0171]|uniref:alpha/beta hydrolase n=1 Tax=Calothrix sp. UHCC 0171 TaxID=3110245 RepID=UPI002B22056C|nr:alpha/beta fold hydrolase [Calothrix sp. UHCC 0171]MEA5573666.1 alpha/beta fold hydrolase [Calothrix sp. UHCC 0171]